MYVCFEKLATKVLFTLLYRVLHEVTLSKKVFRRLKKNALKSEAQIPTITLPIDSLVEWFSIPISKHQLALSSIFQMISSLGLSQIIVQSPNKATQGGGTFF